MCRFALDDVRRHVKWRLVSRGNDRALTDRWLQVLWLAVLRDAWGGACDSSNRQTKAHHRPQPERRCDVYQDYVHSAGINQSSAGDRITAYLAHHFLLYCVVSPIIL